MAKLKPILTASEPLSHTSPRYRTNFDGIIDSRSFEPRNNMPSLTIPDESLTVEQIITRYAHGLPPSIVQPYYYEENPDFDNIDPTQDGSFDLADYTHLQHIAHLATLSDTPSQSVDEPAQNPTTSSEGVKPDDAVAERSEAPKE